MTAVLQVGKRPSCRIHLISCCAPTRARTREVKDPFFQELECIISPVPSGEMYVLLGDSIACVGSRECAGEEWSSVRGLHGFGCTNDSGKELLSFLALHEAMVCNTWFRKNIYNQTGQHPKFRQWHCLDYGGQNQSGRGAVKEDRSEQWVETRVYDGSTFMLV